MAVNASPKSAPPYKQQTLAIMAKTNTFKTLDIKQTLEKKIQGAVPQEKSRVSVTGAIFITI